MSRGKSVTVTLNFLKRLELYETEKPYRLYVGQPLDAPDAVITNVQTGPTPGIQLTDARGDEDKFLLDVHGFQFVKHDQSFSNFDDAQAVERDYLPAVERVISDNVGYADRVVVFDWRVRQQMEPARRDPNILVSPVQLQQPTFALAPSQTVHTDATEYTLLKRVRKHLGDEAEELLKGRVQMINFWRPIGHPIHNWPLILCDARTSSPENLIAVDQVGRRFVGDIYYAPFDESYRWYYQSAMTPQEGVIFKNWDTGKPGTNEPKLCLHTSCALPEDTLPPNAPPRHSIETRALVFSSN